MGFNYDRDVMLTFLLPLELAKVDPSVSVLCDVHNVSGRCFVPIFTLPDTNLIST
jgi:hypothetical protein